MQETKVAEIYFKARYSLFKYRYNLTLANKIAWALGMACATGLMAQIRIPLFWTPVPITGQTFAVLIAGVLLGRWWGGISQAIYVVLGIAGIPWFNGWSGGYTSIIGPTGGYLIGFILASLFLGYFTDRYIRSRSFLSMFGLMVFANFVLIHIPGLLQLGFWLSLVKGVQSTPLELLWMGTIPFIIGDLVKIALAAGVTKVITPKKAYGSEVDTENAKKWRVF